MKVTGWTYPENKKYVNPDSLTDEEFEEALETISTEIREKGYKINGQVHQYDSCCPVIDNKYVFLLSMRKWGSVMQKAYDLPNEDGLGYVLWAWGNPNNEEAVLPERELGE